MRTVRIACPTQLIAVLVVEFLNSADCDASWSVVDNDGPVVVTTAPVAVVAMASYAVGV